jgi:multicomponent Na+:H+ antiporter subunit E
MRRIVPKALTALWFVAVWVLLWGEISAANIVGGLVAGAVVTAATSLAPTGGKLRVRPVPAVAYLARFIADLVTASAQVAVQVFWPVHRLRPGIIEVPMHTTDPMILTFVANTITLTPGTMTIEIDPAAGRLWVHALHLDPDTGVADVKKSAYLYESHSARTLGRPLGAEVVPSREANPREADR